MTLHHIAKKERKDSMDSDTHVPEGPGIHPGETGETRHLWRPSDGTRALDDSTAGGGVFHSHSVGGVIHSLHSLLPVSPAVRAPPAQPLSSGVWQR